MHACVLAMSLQVSVRVTFDRGDVEHFISEAIHLNDVGTTKYQTIVAGGPCCGCEVVVWSMRTQPVYGIQYAECDVISACLVLMRCGQGSAMGEVQGVKQSRKVHRLLSCAIMT
jgi:hypothetical protein